MLKKPLLSLLFLSAVVAAVAGCPEKKLKAVRLPDLNVPRAGHSVFVVNGEPTLVGGHTSGFVPTATAEYYRDGEWHLLRTVYPHDQGFSTPLSSGKVLIGGGHEQPLGIGQIFSVEMYDPATHTFRGFGCLDRKRCFATGLEMDSGRVVIAGNWYNGDAIEQFDGQKYFTHLEDVSQFRACPYVFPVADGDIFVFGDMDYHGGAFDTIIVDRLRGEPLRVPLFDEWKPLRILTEVHAEDFHIGNQVYLIPVINSKQQVAVCRVEASGFSLLPTDNPIPMEYQGCPINYYHSVCVDRHAHQAYLFGYSKDDGRLHVIAIDLSPLISDLRFDSSGGSSILNSQISNLNSPLTHYYTEPMEPFVWSRPVLTPEGNLLIVGGAKFNADGTVDNFSPVANTLLLPLGRLPQDTGQASSSWLWLLLILIALLAAGATSIWLHRKTAKMAGKAKNADAIDNSEADEALMRRICQLMDEERLFINSDLKMADVANRLATNASYVSACINRQRGCSFIQFVNGYRIEYAKQLLRQYPDKKISEVWTVTGFANETSFFRTFKAMTGVTTSEWRAKNV